VSGAEAEDALEFFMRCRNLPRLFLSNPSRKSVAFFLQRLSQKNSGLGYTRLIMHRNEEIGQPREKTDGFLEVLPKNSSTRLPGKGMR
jgi:hypothetical protein